MLSAHTALRPDPGHGGFARHAGAIREETGNLPWAATAPPATSGPRFKVDLAPFTSCQKTIYHQHEFFREGADGHYIDDAVG